GMSLIAIGGLVWVFSSKIGSALARPPQLPPAIAIFLPDPTRFAESAFYQDGVVQKRGFDKAIQDSEDLPNRLNVEFHYMKKEDSADGLLTAMRNSYMSNGATYFIMTMSGKVSGVRQYFTKWHDTCLKQGKREPILIATVASAPNLPAASGAILRCSIR